MWPTITFQTAGIARIHPAMKLDCRRRYRRDCRILAIAGTAERIDARKPANLYEVLRVKETASLVEIKSAYRSLAKRFHPDAALSDSDGRDFMEIHNAYAMLSDPAARARYDVSVGGGGRFRGCSGNRYGSGRQTRKWETDQCW